jgi:DNA invertase Pin-like site-specific DNA recombinase
MKFAENKRFIAYYRVSTQKQGRSGLGLEAQEKAVHDYLNGGNSLIVESFVEMESGRKTQRPKLANALAAARKHNAVLIIAKLDRLARNVAFVSGLMETGVPFVAADRPDATPFEIHIFSAMAEEEARQASQRTKAALGAAKARGVKLGNPDPEKASTARIRIADDFAGDVYPVIKELHASGLRSLRAVAKGLEARGILTPRGKQNWTGAGVRNLVLRVRA